jgi:lipopolysaccharide export LptBFGC system permease protein LptF
MALRTQLNWRRSLILTAVALAIGIACLIWGLEASGSGQIALLTAGAVAIFLFFAGTYVTLVRRYYYRQK